MYTLYVIPGSHACRSAMLMLEHKQVPYRRVDLVTFLHPMLARVHGFDAGGQTRSVGGRRSLTLRLGDHLATVPGLAVGNQRISTNYRIARFLEERHAEPPLFPTPSRERSAVEEAERWGNDRLQMDARRILTAPIRRDPSAANRLSADGRLGPLLYKHALSRRVFIPALVARAFAPSPTTDRRLLAELPATLDRIDRWIADGVLGGAELNVADFVVVPSLALILYRPDAAPLFEGRPVLQLVDRLLPDPDRLDRPGAQRSPGRQRQGQ
jgi:glutathione S-transferase